ncbi:MAG: hypothetical protein FWF40_02870 [Methanomassiliicoccaceae archaeon]|jgi:hypothetical protein|nr:hypothetical protein [Methanomassiliicoccaceae archaeon]
MAIDKTIVFLLAGLLVGAGVGIGVGYFVFSDNGDETYWYYIDFNGTEGTFDSGWFSAKASDPAEGLKKALGDKLEWSSSELYGFGIDEIGGVAGSTSAPWVYWAQWGWTSAATDNGSFTENDVNLADALGNIFYIIYGEWGVADPNMQENGWDTSGPFPAAA